MRLVPVLVLTVLIALGGCSSSDDAEDSGAASQGESSAAEGPDAEGTDGTAAPKPTGPDCAEVWKTGEDLPADYEICVRDGRAPEQEEFDCQDGSRLIVFDNASFARPGQEIETPKAAPMQDGPEFADEYSACTGE